MDVQVGHHVPQTLTGCEPRRDPRPRRLV